MSQGRALDQVVTVDFRVSGTNGHSGPRKGGALSPAGRRDPAAILTLDGLPRGQCLFGPIRGQNSAKRIAAPAAPVRTRAPTNEDLAMPNRDQLLAPLVAAVCAAPLVSAATPAGPAVPTVGLSDAPLMVAQGMRGGSGPARGGGARPGGGVSPGKGGGMPADMGQGQGRGGPGFAQGPGGSGFGSGPGQGRGGPGQGRGGGPGTGDDYYGDFGRLPGYGTGYPGSGPGGPGYGPGPKGPGYGPGYPGYGRDSNLGDWPNIWDRRRW